MNGTSAVEMTELIEKASRGDDLAAGEAQAAFGRIMRGEATDVEVAALLVALRTKGEAPSEVAGGVRALREAMVPVSGGSLDTLIDTCGTGGGSVTTFNISTTAAIVAAGAGVRIAKHGNRSFTSKSGSADVLEALGVRIELSPEAMGRVLEEAGIVFMFAPLLHPAMRHVAPVRRALGMATIMNLLGPLTNPAGVRRQVVGVSSPGLLDLIGEALRELGHERAMVVHGEPGMDELSPCGPTRVREIVDGELRSYTVSPADFGWEDFAPGALAGGDPAHNASVLEGVVYGEIGGAPRAATALNAAAALVVAGAADGLEEGVEAAREAIESGAAAERLDSLREASREAAESE